MGTPTHAQRIRWSSSCWLGGCFLCARGSMQTLAYIVCPHPPGRDSPRDHDVAVSVGGLARVRLLALFPSKKELDAGAETDRWGDGVVGRALGASMLSDQCALPGQTGVEEALERGGFRENRSDSGTGDGGGFSGAARPRCVSCVCVCLRCAPAERERVSGAMAPPPPPRGINAHYAIAAVAITVLINRRKDVKLIPGLLQKNAGKTTKVRPVRRRRT